MKQEEHIQIDEWIALYQNGTLDKESLKKLTQWASASEENRMYVRSRLEVWFSAGVAGDTTCFDKDKAYQRFTQRITDVQLSAKKRNERTSFKLWKTVQRIAAVIVIILLPLAGYWQSEKNMQGRFSDITIEAPLGSHTKLSLPDGTVVWLNSGSKIVYSQGFGIDNRNLEMDGEGYFEVARNENIPFKVHTKELELQVLGTKFNFRNYADDSEVIINLLEGKVALYDVVRTAPAFYVNPDEKVVMNKKTGKMTRSSTNVQQSNTWINDELFFDEELLIDIAKRLMRSYNVQIEVADSLKNRRFYGTFRREENSIEQILSAIASTKHMHYSYEDGKFILY